MTYWLIKSEPDVYGIDDLKKEQVGIWDGVRNYQARNFLKSILAMFQHTDTSPYANAENQLLILGQNIHYSYQIDWDQQP